MPMLACSAVQAATQTCSALSSTPDIPVQCRLQGRQVDCSRSMAVGTVATMSPRCSVLAQYRNVTCLSSGSWDSPLLACSPATQPCPALASIPDIPVQCQLKGRLVDCSRPVKAGTIARMLPRCSVPDQYRQITCLSSGSWDSPMLACSPEAASCPALASTGVDLRCELSRRNVDCSRPMEVGTVAKMNPRCSVLASYRIITCNSSGSWDRPVLSCSAGTQTCPALSSTPDVPVQCRLQGRQVDCSSPVEVGTVATISPECSDDFLLPRNAQYKNITCLSSGSWDNPLRSCSRTGVTVAPATGQRCPALDAMVAVTTECLSRGQPVNCSRPMEVGTVAKMTLRCSSKEFAPGVQHGSTTCLASGSWDKPAPSCPIGCGQGGRSLGASGTPSQGEFPWHVGVYKLYNGGYEQICAGTIITPKLIITAASCIWKNTRGDEPINASLYKVAAGKLRRDWDSLETHEQKRGVASVLVSDDYTGISTSFTSNMALMKLSTPLELSGSVNAVCLNRSTNSYEQARYLAGKPGFVAGWAFTEEDSPGAVLRSVQLPHVNYTACLAHLAPILSRQLTGTTFCAGSTDDNQGYTLCDSDQGAGHVVLNEEDRKYYLQGVASVAIKPITNRETCYPSHVVNFSTITWYFSWIDAVIRSDPPAE